METTTRERVRSQAVASDKDVPPTIPAGMTIAEYSRARSRDRRVRPMDALRIGASLFGLGAITAITVDAARSSRRASW